MLQYLNIFKKHNFLLSIFIGITLLLSPSYTHTASTTKVPEKSSTFIKYLKKVGTITKTIILKGMSWINLLKSIKPILSLAIFEILAKAAPTVPLAEYKVDYANISAMTQQMNIDAKAIPVCRLNVLTPSVSRSFTRDVILMPLHEAFFNKGENLFILGHELSHIAHKHVLKRLALAFIAPFAIRAGLTIFHKLTKKGLQAITERYKPVAGSWLDKTLKTTDKVVGFLSRNPFMEALYINRLYMLHRRSQEKEADLDSARLFNTAADGISLMQKVDAMNRQDVSPIKLRIHEFFDEHPTCAERIAYLKPLAEAQQRQALAC